MAGPTPCAIFGFFTPSKLTVSSSSVSQIAIRAWGLIEAQIVVLGSDFQILRTIFKVEFSFITFPM